MIRRKFMKYAPKEHNDEKVKKSLEKHNVPVFEGNQPAKFGQFGNVAKDLAAKSRKTFTTPDGGHVAPADKTFSWQQKAVYGGGGTGNVKGQADSRNPYAVSQPQGNPYASNSLDGTPQSSSNPYGSAHSSSNPYGSGSSSTDPYGSASPSGATPTPNYAHPRSSSSASRERREALFGSQQDSYGDPNSFEPSIYGSDNQGPNQYDSNRYESNRYESNPSGSSHYGSNPYGSEPYGSGQPYNQDYRSEQYGSTNQPSSNRYGTPNQYGQQPRESRYGNAGSFGEPLARTQTNQTTASSNARNELFGSAPRRVNPESSEFDELNRTHTELEEDDELLNTSRNLDRPQYMAHSSNFPSIPENLDPEDELNQLPSEFQRPADLDASRADGPGYSTGQQLFEDSEDEDVDYVKSEIRQTKQESVESTRRALQIAAEAETSGRNAMGMLGDQGERLGNSAKTVALGHVQARVGDRNAEELQRLNRSIFIPNVSNPFNSRRRNQLKEQRLKSEKEFDSLEREALEQQQRESEQRVADGLNSAGYGYSETALRAKQRMNRDNPERKMYQFEADSDDDALEDELDQNLDGISDAAKRLHGLSLKINDEVTDQNGRVDQMGGRVDDLDYSLHRSTAKMATIL